MYSPESSLEDGNSVYVCPREDGNMKWREGLKAGRLLVGRAGICVNLVTLMSWGQDHHNSV